MRALLGKVLIVLSLAGVVYGVYLAAGKGWAVLLGSFCVYVAGYHLTLRRKPPRKSLRAGEDLEPGTLCHVGPDGRVYAATNATNHLGRMN